MTKKLNVKKLQSELPAFQIIENGKRIYKKPPSFIKNNILYIKAEDGSAFVDPFILDGGYIHRGILIWAEQRGLLWKRDKNNAIKLIKDKYPTKKPLGWDQSPLENWDYKSNNDKKLIKGYYKSKEIKAVCMEMANIAKKIITNRTKV